MNNKLEYYKATGQTSLLLFIGIFILIFIVSTWISAMYSIAMWNISSIFFKGLVYIIVLISLSLIINKTIKYSRLTNQKRASIFSWTIILSFYYIHWVFWMNSAILNHGNDYKDILFGNSSLPHTIQIALQPQLLWAFIIESSTILSAILWILELIGFLLLAFTAGIIEDAEPYSNKNKLWFNKLSIPVNLFDSSKMLDAISNNDHNFFKNLQIHTVSHHNYCLLHLFSSPSEPNYLTLTKKIAEPKSGGNVDFNNKTQVLNVRINDDISNILLEIVNNNASIKKSETAEVLDKEAIKDKPIVEDHKINKAIAEVKSQKTLARKTKIIDKPEIIIKPKQRGIIQRILVFIAALFVILMGIIFIAVTIEMDAPFISILMSIFIIFGLFLMWIAFKPSDKKNYGIKISPSKISIYNTESVESNYEIIVLINDIEAVKTAKGTHQVVTTTLFLKESNTVDLEHINLVLSEYYTDWKSFDKILNILITKSTNERVKILEKWENKLKEIGY